MVHPWIERSGALIGYLCEIKFSRFSSETGLSGWSFERKCWWLIRASTSRDIVRNIENEERPATTCCAAAAQCRPTAHKSSPGVSVGVGSESTLLRAAALYDMLAITRAQSMVTPGTAVICVCPLSARGVARP